MSLRLASRFARRELRGGLRGFRLFLACLALGVAAIAAVGSVRSGIQAGLEKEGAALLGGDVELELTYRFANEAEADWMNSHATSVSEIAEFRSMATTATDRALTQVKAVDAAYPLVGSVTLSPHMPLADALAVQAAVPGAVMERALMDRLGLVVGDRFSLGSQPFELRAEIVREPDNVASGFSLGPRTLVMRDSLAQSGLLSSGTLFNSKYRLILTDPTDITHLETEAAEMFPNSGMRWRDARNGAPGVSRFVDRLSAFLVLVGLSGLAVGGVGVSAAVRSYLSRKTEVIATLRALGADRQTIFQTYFIQIGALSLLGVAIGVTLGAIAPLVLAPILEARLPIPAEFRVFPAPLFEAAIYGLLTAFIFTLWPLARTDQVRAATLFRDAWDGASRAPAWPFILITGGAIATLIAIAGWFNGNWWLTLWTLGGIAGALALLSISAFIIRITAKALSHRLRGRPRWRWAMAAIGGTGEGAGAVVLSLGLGLSVLAAVGQIDGNLRQAIAGNLPDVAPSYFFVDIQKDQMEGYSKRLSDDPAVSRVDSAPMLRGIISQINGAPAAETAGDHWVLQGDRGVTYAATAGPRANITHGTWWDADYSGPPLISFATEEAIEMGLEIGDSLTVNILGRDITGEIANFQEVDFSTAGIGFILTMNPGALEGAPHTFISTVYAEERAEAAILRDLANAYPNITAIRVRDAIERVAGVLGGLAAATSYGAAATLFTGFLVLIGAAAAGADARTYEAAILKTLGASRRMIAASFILRAVLLGLAAGGVALIAGALGGWAVSTFVMETDYSVIWPSALLIIAGGIIATVLAGLGFARRALHARPAGVLRARE
ncbi:ABC transporter permease [Sulfitobacter donghicola]|uniref:Drug:proton antiporter n=1 Tax=Sulfitobacter donghicola DSW-25 = KCTC 12864 = JCM 14565 TaxID=1300350 RepID=A0A073IH68_9RHOB|nr:FtsX-like permease family protein [Sulfitobacter donghicola]KEJ89109.1 drug:proton antiporter [Sulfitobacter donghicola DSW-25 = KCTC 12864 = JCM 14565]KIN67314.1 Efflux ABC transporter, permease protein [Sulfitobacter donghicola DSW-25 = KCTC 12864 = JCM 14565]